MCPRLTQRIVYPRLAQCYVRVQDPLNCHEHFNPVRLLKFSLSRPFPRYEIRKKAINFLFGVGEQSLSQDSRSGEFSKIHAQTLSQSHFQSKTLGVGHWLRIQSTRIVQVDQDSNGPISYSKWTVGGSTLFLGYYFVAERSSQAGFQELCEYIY